jgi:hypothetical protein
VPSLFNLLRCCRIESLSPKRSKSNTINTKDLSLVEGPDKEYDIHVSSDDGHPLQSSQPTSEGETDELDEKHQYNESQNIMRRNYGASGSVNRVSRVVPIQNNDASAENIGRTDEVQLDEETKRHDIGAPTSSSTLKATQPADPVFGRRFDLLPPWQPPKVYCRMMVK